MGFTNQQRISQIYRFRRNLPVHSDMKRWTWKNFFASRLFFIGGVFLLTVLSYELIQAQLKDREFRMETEKLQEEVNSLERERASYEQLLALIKTTEFMEKEARRSLGYIKPGEQVVIIESQDKPDALDKQSAQAMSNPRKWWVYFFGSS